MKEKKLKLEKLRRKAKSNYYFFCKHVLGYDLMEINPHKELCNFVIKDKSPKKLILMPRGSFKSSVVTTGYALFRIVNNPNIRILVNSETLGQAKTFLKGVKNHIENNDTLKTLFGDLRPANIDTVWRQDEITTAGRTNAIMKEPTISVAGVGQAKVGMHYDLIIFDDVVSNKNINTQEQVQKIIDHYRLMLSILDPGAEFIIIGTRYSYADLYGHIIENEADQFAMHIRAAIQKDGSLLFPERLTHEFLATQKKAQGASHFANQYMNEPVDEDSAFFKSGWLKFYTEAPLALRHYITVDPASSLDQQADYTAMVVSGITPDNDIVVREPINVRVTIRDFLDLLFEKVQQYDVYKDGAVGIETNAMQKMLKFIIQEEMQRRGFFFPIVELKPHGGRSKSNRIKGLQPWFENGKIYVKKDMYALIDQITRYPRTKHDDLIDALAYILEIMSPADKPKIDKWANSTLSYADKLMWQECEEAKNKKRFVHKRSRYAL